MKFTNGYWRMRDGVTPHYAAQAHEITIEPDAVTVYAAIKKMTGRGDSINLPDLTIRFSSPMANVIRVETVHHKGTRQRGPAFAIHSSETKITIIEDEGFATLTSGDLSVRVHKTGDWLVQYTADNRVLTSSGWRGMGYLETPEGNFIHEQLNLGVGECVYGLGERFTSFVKNGQVADMWNQDGGTSSEQA